MPGIPSRVAPWLVLFTALAVVLLSGPWTQEDNLRIAIDIAGDDRLPGATPFPDWQATRNFVDRLAEARSRAAYLDFLHADDRSAAALVALFLSIGLITWRRVPHAWHAALAGAAIAYAASDWKENDLLRSAVEKVASDAAPYVAASLATNAKWAFGVATVVLALAQFVLFLGPWRPWLLALFYDAPYFVDRAFRRLEFRANQEFTESAASGSHLRPRAPWKLVAFWLFAATVAFLCYGPTLAGFCSVSPRGVRVALAVIGMALLGAVAWFVLREAKPWVGKRLPEYPFGTDPDPAQQCAGEGDKRRAITVVALCLCGGLFLAPALFASFASFAAAQGACEASSFSPASVWRLVLAAAAIAIFAFVWRSGLSTRALLAWQAAIIAATALIYWFALATPDAMEASGAPYRHVFAVVAPVVAIVLAIMPAIARRTLREPLASLAAYFERKLGEHELFRALPQAPLPTAACVAHALLYGISYRWLQVALIPSLIVLEAPPDWLVSMTLLGLLVAIGLSTWGNLAPRWRQMTLIVERWFLRGAAFFVSLFVGAVALCRIFGVSYVTTLLDAAPFGVIFSGTVMCYVLAWGVEYWINRAAAAELLAVLGNRGPLTAMHYPYARQPELAVEKSGRYLMSHSLGRFLVLGKVPRQHSPAFETYGMAELFEALAGEDRPDAAVAVARQLHLYFYAVNALLVLTTAAFGAAYWYANHIVQPPAVVAARAGGEVGLTDLAERLLGAPGEQRPALVVVASGGGTRAAVFAAHVLEGLHKLRADDDIVLLSGVSGGGVALAYFALHYPELTPPAADWTRFKDAVQANYIDDVLKGALEWRVLGAAPLTVLLSETFQRRLFVRAGPEPTFDLPDTPALILNTTVTGHPDDESALLTISLNRPAPRDDCRETSRPYKLMSGGRLIFTNVRNVSAFPRRDVPIADVRLPYVIVRDPAVALAPAAALNANFPPVFPNARVEVRNQEPNAECPDRSYFVTDGGAEENLGLVSALFAVQSALREIADRCAKRERDAWCQRSLRPLHFVIAEASATGYDYEQDRGVQAGIEGAKDRMTGGLTNRLIAETQWMYNHALPRDGSDAQRVRYHFLPMPLVFRSRGGVGTHWTHAATFTLSDPRVRAPHLVGRDTVVVRWSELTRMWTAMHEPAASFCEDASYGSVNTDKVRRWICGWRFDGNHPRDLHMLAWRTLVTDLKSPPLP